MDLQIGIAADRRSEMAVVLARQGIVPLGLGCVGGLLQAAQEAVMDRVFLGLPIASRSTRCSSKRLCGWSIVSPRLRTNSANSSSLNGSGSGCARLQKADFMFGQSGGDCLVGREHEFLDHLVALVMLTEMRPGDMPVAPSSISTSGRESSSAPRVKPAPSQNHRQLEHLAQHRGDLRGDAGMGQLRAAS